MPTPNLTLENGSFVDFEGNPLANGYLLMELSHDEQYSASNYQVVAGLKIKITLDASGNINPTVKVFSNDTLLPVGSYYIVRAFRSDGANAWADFQYWTLSSSPNPLDVGTIVPSNPPSSGSGGGSSSVLLQTNGVSNTVQNVENLISGAGISLTADSLGGTTIACNIGINTQTSSYHLVLSDNGDVCSYEFGVGKFSHHRPRSTTNFPIGASVSVRQVGAGATTVVAGAGVTIAGPGSSFQLAKQYASCQVIKVAANTWDLTGDVVGV